MPNIISSYCFYLLAEKLLHLHNSVRQVNPCPLSINTSSALYSKFVRYISSLGHVAHTHTHKLLMRFVSVLQNGPKKWAVLF